MNPRVRNPQAGPRPTRRSFLAGAGGLALGAGLLGVAGCSSDSGDPVPTSGSATPSGTGPAPSSSAPSAPQVDGDLVYFNYAQYLDPEIISGFEKEYGVKVRQSNYDTYDAMATKIRSEAYDLIFPSADWVDRLVQAELLAPIDRAALSNASTMSAFFEYPWYDAGGAHSMPYNYYKAGVLYRTDKIDPVTSWEAMWSPDATGKIYMFDDAQAAISMALQALGLDMNSTNPTDVDAAAAKLIEQKAALGGYFFDFYQPLPSGEAWMQFAYNGQANVIRGMVDDPKTIAWATMTEGNPVTNDAMVIPANAQHPGTAMAFINYLLEPENLVRNVNFTGYAMPYSAAQDEFVVLSAGDETIDLTLEELEQAQTKGLIYQNLGEEGTRLWLDTWTKVRAS